MNHEARFEEFWRIYPRRVGKLAARKEYDKVIKSGAATQEELLDGIAQYLRTKPSYADFCHPRTWLSQGRWMDEVPTRGKGLASGTGCPHKPRCLSNSACIERVVMDARRGIA